MALYWKLLGASLRAQMQYKINFLASSVTYGLIMMVDYLILAAILYRFDQVKGWDIYEVGILYGIASASMSLYRLIAPEIHDFERYIVQGEFDSLLIRPVSPLILLLTRNLDLGRIGGIVQGLIIVGISLAGLAHTSRLSVPLVAYLPIAIIGGAVICFSIALVTATIAFWTHQIKELQVFTLYAPFNAANYPINLYPGWLKVLFFTVIPVAFVNYVPVMYLLHKGGGWLSVWATPLVAALSLFLSVRFWNYGIRHYHSTGS